MISLLTPYRYTHPVSPHPPWDIIFPLSRTSALPSQKHCGTSLAAQLREGRAVSRQAKRINGAGRRCELSFLQQQRIKFEEDCRRWGACMCACVRPCGQVHLAHVALSLAVEEGGDGLGMALEHRHSQVLHVHDGKEVVRRQLRHLRSEIEKSRECRWGRRGSAGMCVRRHRL